MAFDIEPNSTVNNIKDQIRDITGVGQRIHYCSCSGDNRPYDPLRLIYGGKELENEKSLCDYDIRHESILHRVYRLHGA